ncbi:DRC9, partial [Symbiodinium microadriaticum]
METRLERLDHVEAERIISILEDSTEKLNFLDRITPDVLQHRDELSKFIGDEISRTMNEQKYLERRYEELIEHRSSMKGMVNKTKYKEVQEEIQDVSRALRESTNNLVRNLKENPNVSGNLIK